MGKSGARHPEPPFNFVDAITLGARSNQRPEDLQPVLLAQSVELFDAVLHYDISSTIEIICQSPAFPLRLPRWEVGHKTKLRKNPGPSSSPALYEGGTFCRVAYHGRDEHPGEAGNRIGILTRRVGNRDSITDAPGQNA